MRQIGVVLRHLFLRQLPIWFLLITAALSGVVALLASGTQGIWLGLLLGFLCPLFITAFGPFIAFTIMAIFWDLADALDQKFNKS